MILATFDLDGVLMQNPFGKYVFPELARRLSPYLATGQHLPIPLGKNGAPISPLPQNVRMPGLTDAGREVVAAIWAQTAVWLAEGDMRKAYDWDAASANIARKLGCSEQIDVVELVEEGCKRGYVWAYPAAQETLQMLVDSNISLVAVSNGFNCYQVPVLKTIGLYHYFNAMVSPAEVGLAKPNPAIFAAARKAVGATNDTPAVHVGDTVVCDIAGGNAAGMKTIWVNDKLPEEVLACTPWERPGHPLLMSHLMRVAEREFAAAVYSHAPENLVPSAVVCDMTEVPRTIRHLLDSLPTDKAEAV